SYEIFTVLEFRRVLFRSVRHSFASSTDARVRFWAYSLSLVSNFSKSVKASAVAPAKPAITLPSARRRSLRALPFITTLSRLTWQIGRASCRDEVYQSMYL